MYCKGGGGGGGCAWLNEPPGIAILRFPSGVYIFCLAQVSSQEVFQTFKKNLLHVEMTVQVYVDSLECVLKKCKAYYTLWILLNHKIYEARSVASG